MPIRAEDGRTEVSFSGRRGIQDRVRHDGVRQRIDHQRLPYADRGVRAGVHRRPRILAELAGHDHSHGRRARVTCRHVRVHGAVWIFAQQSVAVWTRAGDRYRGGRCDCGRGKRRAIDGDRAIATRCEPQGDGRSDRSGHCHLVGPLCRVCSDRFHGRDQRPVLQAVRLDDRRFDGDFGVQFADAQPSSLCAAAKGHAHGGEGTAKLATAVNSARRFRGWGSRSSAA